MKFHTSTIIRFFLAHFTLWFSFLYPVYLPEIGYNYGSLMLCISMLLLTTFPDKGRLSSLRDCSKDINIWQFLCILISMILAAWFVVSKDTNFGEKFNEFVQENKWDYKFIGLISVLILSCFINHYKRLKSLTPQEIVEYYEAK